jgi:DNA-binding XRE family transcriptional regulator
MGYDSQRAFRHILTDIVIHYSELYKKCVHYCEVFLLGYPYGKRGLLMSKRTLGERIIYLRSKKNISQATLARQAGLPYSTLCSLEKGLRSGEKVSLGIAKRLALALGVTLDYLAGMYEDEEDEESKTAAVAMAD